MTGRLQLEQLEVVDNRRLFEHGILVKRVKNGDSEKSFENKYCSQRYLVSVC